MTIDRLYTPMFAHLPIIISSYWYYKAITFNMKKSHAIK